MKQINNILVPIDFSGNALKALAYAVEIAKKTKATLNVVHAYRLIKPNNGVHVSKGTALRNELETMLNQKLKEVEFEYLVSHPIEYSLSVVVGFPLDVIQTMITDKDIDLLVMGARGSREQEEIFGSTTWSTIKCTSIPVLTVPHEAPSGLIEHIILANESPADNDKSSMQVVDQIANSFQSEVVILKCNNEANAPKAANSSGYKTMFKGLKVQTQSCDRNQFLDGIKDQLSQYKNDLLVLLPKENVFLESYFTRENLKTLIIDTKVPLLMIQKPLVRN